MNEIVTRPDAAPPMASTNAGGLLNIIAQAASDPNFDMERLKQLFAMQKEVLADEALRSFQTAMALAQAEMPSVVKNAENPHLKSKYAQLEAIDDAIRPVYTRHGFSLMFSQRDSATPGDMTIVCTVSHKDGHSITQPLPGKVDSGPGRSANQAVGSTISYLRRYLTLMIFNVVVRNEDNDGHMVNRAHLTRINEAQKAEITALLKECADAKIETADFYIWIREHMGAETIDDLKASDYPRVVTGIKAKIKAAGAPA